MRNFDFSPLFRSTVGFDPMVRILESVLESERASSGYPLYDIEKTGESAYRISIAVAGFGEDELDVEARDNTLVISGKIADEEAEKRFLHRGIAGRAFRRSFQLADYVTVVGARLENGILHVELERVLPDALKPRKIEIATSTGAKIAKKAKELIEGGKKAA